MNVDKLIASLPGMSDADRRGVRENVARLQKSGTDPQRMAAQKVLAALDDHEGALVVEKAQRVAAMTPAERVVEAFRERAPNETEVLVIQALLDHPNATSAELTKACGWQGQSWHLHFGTMCLNRQADLWPADKSETRDATFYSGILAEYDESTGRWTMKPEVVAAFAEVGLKSRKRT